MTIYLFILSNNTLYFDSMTSSFCKVLNRYLNIATLFKLSSSIDRLTLTMNMQTLPTLFPNNVDRQQLQPATTQTLETFRDSSELIAKRQPDTPVHCFCPKQLDERLDLFVRSFPGKVGFAVKANGEPIVLDRLAKQGIDFFDAASLTEISLLRKLEVDAAIFYDNPIKSEYEIQQAYFTYGVRSFVLDDESELDKIQSIVGTDPEVQLTVRFKIAGAFAAQDLNTKFGADVETASTLLASVAKAGYKPALTFHPGSQCFTPSAYANYIEAAAKIAQRAKVKIVMLNVGGGFPADYRNSSAPPLAEFFKVIESQFNRYFDASQCELVCEPGRGLVASSCSLLTRVKHRRKNSDKNILFLNDGIYGGFMEQFVTFFELPVRVHRGSQLLLDTLEEFKVYGPTCDSSDCFTESILLPASINAGDWIEFGLTGAYGSATTTRFNGYSSEHYVQVERSDLTR